LGTSEVILYPHLTAKYGTGWLGWITLALFFQTVWGMELARWVVVSGEHGAQFNARVISKIGAILFITFLLFVGLSVPVWATSAAAALWEIVRIPADIKQGTVLWGCLTFLFVFALIFFSRIARKWAETISVITLIICWIILVIAVCCCVSPAMLRSLGKGILCFNIPQEIDLWTLGSTIAWAGTGPGLLWYTYWMRDAGWGMAKYIGPIPGWFGKTTKQVRGVYPVRTHCKYKTTGILPTDDSEENISNLKIWVRRSHWTIWLGYFVGSFVTILIFTGLSDVILRPRGLVPAGFNVVKYQAEFFVPVCGAIGASLFLIMAWLLFFNTQLGISESLVRQNADATTSLFGVNIKKSYFIWWGVYLVISFALIFLLAYHKDLTIFKYITYAAMTSAVALVISMGATFIGSITLYRNLPPRIRRTVQPSIVWIFLLGVGLIY
ncbi:MAG: Nramp family divalent metal transporter, partial [Planctomycetota bacterium]|nr:Nramp family divalent metal transporter [Planctomycetota bacterium]